MKMKLGKVIHGDAQTELSEMEAESFEACVTDPPYELGFMGKSWDESGIAFDPEFWEEVYRVLKPGAHLLSFGGTRTHHRMMAAIEDAGFEIRDTLTWHYGGGFPKATDMSKTIDRRKGKFDEREEVGIKPGHEKFANRETTGHLDGDGGSSEGSRRPWQEKEGATDYHKQTAPASEEAKKWEGWKTGLKPATEFICMARKPFDGATVDALLEHGVGALNVDECRIGTEKEVPASVSNKKGNVLEGSKDGSLRNETGNEEGRNPNVGRYPSNLLLDDRASALLDGQSGETTSGAMKEAVSGYDSDSSTEFIEGVSGPQNQHGDSGGASRFFYCPKASTSERNMGVEENDHPTVKPVELMGYLIRLVTPEGGKVLDPFGGSGTTGMAAVLEQKEFVIVEKDEESATLAENRIKHVEDNYQRVREKTYGDPSNELTDEQTEVNDHDFW